MIRPAIILLALTMPAAMMAFGQTPPQQVQVSDLIQGYVSLGTIITTQGHLAFTGGRARLNPSMPSAMVPAIVEITGLPPSDQERLQKQCTASSITSGGCRVRVEGRVQKIDGRPGLLATRLDFQ
jgi:hypothetical protein